MRGRRPTPVSRRCAKACKGNGRRTAIRAIGRLERPEMIPLIAPALDDGVGIRAEAANALAQMARTPAAVAEVQKLLLARAATDASLNTWESWGEIAAALGRLPYDTAAQVAADRSGAVDRTAGAGFDERRRNRGAGRSGARPRIAGAHRAREEAAAARRAHAGICCAGPPPRSGRAADPRSALTRRLAMAALVTGNQATASVIERGLNDTRRRGAPLCGGRRRRPTRAIDDRERMIKIALADKEPRVRLEALRAWGRLLPEDLVRADPRGASRTPIRTSSCRRSISSASRARRTRAPIAELSATRRHARQRAAHVACARPRPGVAGAHAIRKRRARRCRASSSIRPGRCACMPPAPPASLAAIDELNDARAPIRTTTFAKRRSSALIDLKRPEAVAVALASLTRPDYQLVLTAARALEDKSTRAEGHARRS